MVSEPDTWWCGNEDARPQGSGCGFGLYKWYQSQTPGNVPTRTLGPKGVDCGISDTFLISIWKPLPNIHDLEL